MLRLASCLVVLCTLVACGSESAPAATSAPVAPASTLDLSVEARTQAVMDAVAQRFEQTVRAKYLEQGTTVRGLVRLVTQPKATRARELQPAAFDPAASAAAKLEVVNGKVIYTAVASPDDTAAAVLSDGRERYAVGYVVEAEVAPQGELRDIVVRQVTDARRLN